MPLHRRLPKRGFTNIFKKQYSIVNLKDLEKLEGDNFTVDSLIELGIINKLGDGLKVLGSGEITRKITIEAHIFSKSAAEKIAEGRWRGQSHRGCRSIAYHGRNIIREKRDTREAI